MMTETEQAALALYTPPFRYYRGYLWDAKNNMVADDDAQDVALRVRGWGRISHMEEPEKLQDAVGELMAKALTEYWQKKRGRAPDGRTYIKSHTHGCQCAECMTPNAPHEGADAALSRQVPHE